MPHLHCTELAPVYTMPVVPVLTVAAIIEREGRFLLVEELAHGQRVLNQPAGRVETGETLMQAVVRETIEESAWVFEPTAITGIYLWQQPGTMRRFLRVVFCGNGLAHDTGRRLDKGIIRALWLSPGELKARTASLRSPMVMAGIDDYIAGVRRPVASVGDLPASRLLRMARTV